MRIHEIINEAEEQPGTYAGIKLSDESANAIVAYCEENEIPNPVPKDKLHVTLLYSRKHLPNYTAAGEYDEPYVGEPSGFDVWESTEEDESEPSRCLVLKLNCDTLCDRHKHLMAEHHATFDYDEYSPHVTFSYNLEDNDESNLPPFTTDIELVEEYQNDLELDWADKNT